MTKVFIRYNPYTIETTINIDGEPFKKRCSLTERIADGSRLQEWVEDLPQLLIGACNDDDFEILFYGTQLDYDDLEEVFTKAEENRQLKVKLKMEPAKKISEKEARIKQVFKEIQQGPFEDLKDEELKHSFNQAMSSDFEVCVVATMSAGKSTLINSMLQTKLMPSKQEACTAIITRIKDNDAPNWQAEVYNKEDKLIETHEELTYQTMDRLNSDENVSKIKVSGNIPFVTADDVSLVLIDTPGPNNSRDPEHRRVQSEFLSKTSKSLVLYIMEGTFGSDDDNALLERVAESMSVGGKQSKDRFIFVINKMDDRKKEDGDTNETLEKVRKYLKNHKIVNPNLFPAAALPALNIRMIRNELEVDEDTIDETELKVKKLNRNENLHFENYASLPLSVKSQIKSELEQAVNSGNAEEQALIHTGIPSVEAAIRQYVQKYAKTAKIKTIVNTFMHKLEEKQSFENTKKELASNQDKAREIVEQINIIQNKVDDVKSAQEFKDAVDDAVVKVNDEAQDVVDKIVAKFHKKIAEKTGALCGGGLDIDEAESELNRLERFAKKLEPDFQEELDELIRENLVNVSNTLLQNYRQKLSSLTDELDSKALSGISIDPLSLMSGSVISSDDFSFRNFIHETEVEDGDEWVKNTDKKWYKPWTWFQEKGYYRTKYKTVERVDAGEMAYEFLQPIEDVIHENGENAVKYTLKQSKKISEAFSNEFKRLDDVLKKKLDELKSYATDKDRVEERIRETERKLKWLEEIKCEVESILEI